MPGGNAVTSRIARTRVRRTVFRVRRRPLACLGRVRSSFSAGFLVGKRGYGPVTPGVLLAGATSRFVGKSGIASVVDDGAGGPHGRITMTSWHNARRNLGSVDLKRASLLPFVSLRWCELFATVTW